MPVRPGSGLRCYSSWSTAEIVAYLREPDSARDEEIATVLRAHLGAASELGNVELWDTQGRRLLAAGLPFEEATGNQQAQLLEDFQTGDPARIGRLQRDGDRLMYAVGARVTDGGSHAGFAVERRRLSNPAQMQQTMALLTGLIGGESSIIAGNADGSVWTDLMRPIPSPGIDTRNISALVEYQREGMPRTFARAARVQGSPWLIVIESPYALVMAPAQRLLLSSLLVAVVLMLVTTAAGWGLSRLLTTPLRRLARGAAAIAESRPAVYIELERQDELGQLADSFNTMAARVEHARHELEQRVDQRTWELQAANKELEAFSYSVSHDLRAPLRAIAGFVQILDEDHRESLNPQGQHALERVKVNAQRMGQLIDDLLTFSQIGRAPLSRHQVDMTSIARRLADEALSTAAPRRIEITIEPLPACVGEPGLITQVFVNLISNAVKFTARSDRARITIGARQNGETVYFVRDNGAGFDARHAEKLFGVFQRLHAADEFEGTGVGLAIVQRVIHRHGGRVWAEGRPNEGATFYFTLPVETGTKVSRELVAAHE